MSTPVPALTRRPPTSPAPEDVQAIRIHRNPRPPQPGVPETNLGFGRLFTPHMFVAEHDAGQGWHNARVVPYASLTLDPAAGALHYGQTLFEGLKAHRQPDDSVALFRVDAHARRFCDGAARLCATAPPPGLFEQAVSTLVDVERSWVPSQVGTALYLRPTLVATEAFLGVRPSVRHLFFVIASPVGAYYAGGMAPVRIWVEEEMVRAAPGGMGAAKTGGNYAASLLAAERARQRGYDQVLWLDAANHCNVEEVGTMNVFAVLGDVLVTPALSGSILPGITRDAVLTLARGWGLRTQERALPLDEILAGLRTGTLRELFGTGTAAVVAPVGELGLAHGRFRVGDGAPGPVARRLHRVLTGIQRGALPDLHGWMRTVAEHRECLDERAA